MKSIPNLLIFYNKPLHGFSGEMTNLDGCCRFLARPQTHLPYGVAVPATGWVAGGEAVATVAGWVETGTVAEAGTNVVATGVDEDPGTGVCGVGTGVPVPADGVTLALDVGVATNGGLANIPNIASTLSLFTISGACWFKRT